MRALAFDLGGTHLRGAVLCDGALHHPMTQRIQSGVQIAAQSDIWETILSEMADFARERATLLEPSDPIVISFPGPIAGGRRILHAPTVCGAQTAFVDLAAELEARTGRTVHLINDISAAAWHLGKRTPVDRFMVVTISSGIGSKIFDRRHADRVLDQPVYAGEIGHMVVDDCPNALVCDCGGRGHLGAIASGRGVERTARLRAREAPDLFVTSYVCRELGGSPSTLTNEEHIVPAALAGDVWTLNVVRACTRPLARTLLASAMAMGLERVFVIGGFAQALGEVYFDTLCELMVEMSRYDVVREIIPRIVVPGYLYGEPCLSGCGAFLEAMRSTA